MRSLRYFLLHPKDIIISSVLKLRRLLPDKLYLKVLFRLKVGYKLNLKNPKTFNEKLNWLKLYYHNPIFTVMADKLLVKEYVRNMIGDSYVVKCYGNWDSFEEIDFESLPDQFVLKTNHDSSGATICLSKNSFDYKKSQMRLSSLLENNWFWYLREWPYKNIKPQILAEEYLNDNHGSELRDYKFWCFNGVPTFMYVTNKGKNIRENFYDMDFNPVNINHGFKRQEPEVEKPVSFDLMKELASKLSHGIPFLRIDFFDVQGHVYFGEFTFYDWGGMSPFMTKEQDLYLGGLINITDLQ